MSDLQTNFNVAPFFDDYNENDQYYRILFRPSTAVQARELTQIQTIMQKQISRFGDSIYKDGSVVSGANFSTYPAIAQVKFKNGTSTTLDFSTLINSYTDVAFDSSNEIINASNTFLLVSNTTGLRASVFRAFVGAEASAPDTNRAYVQYLNTGTDGSTAFSQTSEQIDVYNRFQDKTGPLNAINRLTLADGVTNAPLFTISSNSTVNALGIGYGMHVGQGTVYQKGFFLKNLPQNFIIREHNANASGIKVGFDTKEYIVQDSQDPNLYDNSTGTTNFSAPGAWRLKLVPIATFYDSANTAVTPPKGFSPLIEFDAVDGKIIINNALSPMYSTIGDEIATRVYETAGDFIVKSFNVDVKPSPNNFTMYYVVSPGIAYVDGYRAEFFAPVTIEVPRGIDTGSFNGDSVVLSMGNYYIIQEVAGVLDLSNEQQVVFYDTAQTTLSQYLPRTSPTGNILGYANVRAMKYYSGTNGTPTGQMLLYIFNIRMNSGANPNSIKSVYGTSSFGKFYADVVLDPASGLPTLYGSTTKPLYYSGYPGTKTLLSNTGSNGTTFLYRPTLSAAITNVPTGSSATFTLPGPDIFPFGTQFLDDQTSLLCDVAFAQDTYGYPMANDITITASNSTTTSIASTLNPYFANALYPGDGIALTQISGGSTTYHDVVSQIGQNGLVVTPPTSLTGTLRLRQFFKQGEYINFVGSGNTIQQTATNSLTVNLITPLDTGTWNVYGQIPIERQSANPIQKVVMKNNYIKIDCSTNPGGTTGPWSLGVSDVYQVTNVFVGSTYDVINPDRNDWFTLDNGQTDFLYNNARLSILPQYKNNLTSSSKLLVEFNCFYSNVTTTKAGFYSVDSYPIDDQNPFSNAYAIATAQIPIYYDTVGNSYDLRNYIDMRPQLANSVPIVNVVSSAPINPAYNTSVMLTGGGSQIMADADSLFNYNVTYYLPRKDYIVVTSDNHIAVKYGISATNPQLPSINKAGLPIAEIYVPPYPSLTFTEAE